MDDPSEASGIFTTNEEASKRGAADDVSDIVAGYPALDDESLIISEDGGPTTAASGIFTEQQTQSTPGNKSGVADSSTSGGNTNEIMGSYAKLGNSLKVAPDEKKSNSWLTDAFQKFGLPLMGSATPTAKSSPNRVAQAQVGMGSDLDDFSALTPDKPVEQVNAPASATGIAAGAAAGAATPAEETSKFCGVTATRAILICGCLVIVALAVVVVAVILANDDDSSGSDQNNAIDDPDFDRFLTWSPTASPTTEKVVVIPNCPPDNDMVTFLVTSEIKDCAWLRSREQTFVDVLCETRQDIANECRTTCVNCETDQPSVSPTTAGPTTSSPSSTPSISPTEVGETRAPSPSPTTGQPSPIPSQTPTIPTQAPTGFPTLAPVVTELPTTEAPSFVPTTLAPTATPSTSSPTADTSAPTAPLQNIILAAAPPSTAAALEQADSPQSQALAWMLEDATVASFPSVRIQQLFAIGTLGYALGLNTVGGGLGWLEDYNECNFSGVACQEGEVVEIILFGRDLFGQLPEEVSMLNLSTFDGRNNQFTGPIPSGFGFMPNLATLVLGDNSLTGNIPQSFVNLSGSLRILGVSSNLLTGGFPNEIVSQLTALEVFVCFGNDFNGNIGEAVCELPFLVTLVTDCANQGCYTQCRD